MAASDYQTSHRTFAGVVFDLDGTLIHSAPDIALALNMVLAEEGHDPFETTDAYRFIGAGAKRLVEDAFAARGRPLTDAQITALADRYLATYTRNGSPHTTIYPNARESLAHLRARGLPLAICTNKAEQITLDVLAMLELTDPFAAVIGSDSGYGRKPDAGPLLEVCKRMAVNPADILMVGDTLMDIGVARAVGARAVAVRYGYSQVPVEDMGADFIIDDLSDLVALVGHT